MPRSVPVFRAIPKRLFIFSVGFALGWLVATAISLMPGGDLSLIRYIRLGVAILLVAVMMFFLPVERHHEDTASTTGGHRAFAEDFDAEPASTPKEATSPASATGLESRNPNHSGLTPPIAVSPGLSESEAFDAKCRNIAKLYQLSPREAEILPYLAKGRNNAYLQDKFVISPHTAKSHIYNIYRKLDIHSQQKLMDFVEEFPEDYDV